MSLQELKREIEVSFPEDRLYLLALLKHLTRRDEEEYKKHLADRAQNAGRNSVSLEQVKLLHQALEAEGF